MIREHTTKVVVGRLVSCGGVRGQLVTPVAHESGFALERVTICTPVDSKFVTSFFWLADAMTVGSLLPY